MSSVIERWHMTVIAFGGPYGGGARIVGPLVSSKLGYDYIDRWVLSDVARQLGSTVDALKRLEEEAQR